MGTKPDSLSPEYRIHGGPRSLFTRKLEAAFVFYGLPWTAVPRGIGNDVIGQRAGTHQIPILETPEGWAIGDTTPILDLLDARVPDQRLFPEGPLGVLVHLVEEIKHSLDLSTPATAAYHSRIREQIRFDAHTLHSHPQVPCL